MRVLISGAGSHGDVLPCIAIGQEMRDRGHEVILYANPYFRDYVTAAGIRFVPVSTVDKYSTLFGEFTDSDPNKAMQRVSAELAEICKDYYVAMKADAVAGQTITIGNSLLFAPRLLRETDGIPCATVHLAPCVIRSNLKPARLVPNWIDAGTPTLLKRLALRAGVPQLIRPTAYDQFDNSAHAVALGVARELLPKEYSARTVADALSRLTSGADIRQRCKEISRRFERSRSIPAACDAITSRCAAAQ